MKNRQDWPLLVLSFAGDKGLTPAQLQKTIFLLQKAFPEARDLTYEFQPYNYGPFDARVYDDVEFLAAHGLAQIRQKDGYNWRTYHISPSGKSAAKELAKNLEESVEVYLRRLVSWVQSLSFQRLIGSIYKKYPEFKVNSIFQD